MPREIDVNDFVRIVSADNDVEEYIGAEGMVIRIDERWSYPYEIVFFDKKLQENSIKNGLYLWKERQLEAI